MGQGIYITGDVYDFMNSMPMRCVSVSHKYRHCCPPLFCADGNVKKDYSRLHDVHSYQLLDQVFLADHRV